MHPNHYMIPLGLNENKVFQCTPPPEINTSELQESPEKWLEQLMKDSWFRFSPLNTHIGNQANYTFKKELIEALQLIFYRLNNQLDSQLGGLSEEEKKNIIFKLNEEARACTPGFHNRVNDIVSSFSKPSNLQQLLYLARKGLFTVSPESEIHTWNRISIVASETGLGIKPNLEKDAYPGKLKNKKIQVHLQEIITKRFTPDNIPMLLVEQFKGLIQEYGYIGQADESGYAIDITDKVFKLIKQFISKLTKSSDDEEKWNYFIIDEETSAIRDVNWPLIEEHFRDTLVKERYFISIPTTLQELILAQEQNKYSEEDIRDGSLNIMSRLFRTDKELLSEETQKIKVQFPEFYSQFLQNFDEYLTSSWFEKIRGPRRFLVLLDSITIQKDAQELFLFLAKNHAFLGQEILRKLLIRKNKNAWNSLMITAYSNPETTSTLLQFLSDHREFLGKNLLKELLTQRTTNGKNALMLITAHHPETTTIFLQFLSEHHKFLGKDLIKEIFTQKNQSDKNSLLMTYHDPETVTKFLEFLSKHHEFLGKDILKEVFTQTNIYGGNALRTAIIHHSETATMLLRFLSDHHEILGKELIKEVLIHADEAGWNSLMMAAVNQPKIATTFLNFLSEHHEFLNKDIIKELFIQKSEDHGDNALTLATCVCSKYPETTKNILKYLSEYHKFLGNDLIKEIFINTNKDGWNALMLVTRYQPEIAKEFLKFLSDHHEFLGKDFLKELLAQKNKNDENYLMIAERYHPEVAKDLKLNLPIVSLKSQPYSFFNPVDVKTSDDKQQDKNRKLHDL